MNDIRAVKEMLHGKLAPEIYKRLSTVALELVERQYCKKLGTHYIIPNGYSCRDLKNLWEYIETVGWGKRTPDKRYLILWEKVDQESDK
jgi:hypothetical protein